MNIHPPEQQDQAPAPRLIEARGLVKTFGAFKAVDGISLAVARGEVLGFLGPNGAGKSTTMKILTGYLDPDAGQVRIAGQDVSSAPKAAKRHLGYLPEGAPAYPDMTVLGFLRFIARVRGMRRRESEARILEVADRVHIRDVFRQPIETLSKGYKRRVGLAQALLHDPDVLILDEPTDGLDPNQKHEVRELIRDMAERKAIVLSTHILEEVDAVCDRAVIVARGRILRDTTPQALIAEAPEHNAVRLVLPVAQGDAAQPVLADLPGVASVQTAWAGPDTVQLHILPVEGRSIATVVAQLVRDQGWEVRAMQVEQGQLDTVFRNITTATGAAA